VAENGGFVNWAFIPAMLDTHPAASSSTARTSWWSRFNPRTCWSGFVRCSTRDAKSSYRSPFCKAIEKTAFDSFHFVRLAHIA